MQRRRTFRRRRYRRKNVKRFKKRVRKVRRRVKSYRRGRRSFNRPKTLRVNSQKVSRISVSTVDNYYSWNYRGMLSSMMAMDMVPFNWNLKLTDLSDLLSLHENQFAKFIINSYTIVLSNFEQIERSGVAYSEKATKYIKYAITDMGEKANTFDKDIKDLDMQETRINTEHIKRPFFTFWYDKRSVNFKADSSYQPTIETALHKNVKQLHANSSKFRIVKKWYPRCKQYIDTAWLKANTTSSDMLTKMGATAGIPAIWIGNTDGALPRQDEIYQLRSKYLSWDVKRYVTLTFAGAYSAQHDE